MILFKKLMGIDSAVMREIANNANVKWEYNEIVHQSSYIGYKNGQKEDIQDLKDSSKQVIGFSLMHVPESEIKKPNIEENR